MLSHGSPPKGLSTETHQLTQTRQNRAELGGDLQVAPSTYSKFIQFLTDELAVSMSSIDFAVRHRENSCDPLPMILWQYGLISLEQLDRIFDWLETA
ncbi:DUF2949 domain-containing protein [filamentous cyanobacterium LEGE 11480]|uniref:DUF2949 domain-containing protein n=1 Tax=Romeriopsis navalis LEGE 11480 TaxID=2777977 RepID=A0A928Z482_9CYAN|nr:DUF2949 domain-containing protein [Romeriopsis navalis LEGE 11480]